MFKEQELMLSYLRARIRINFKGEMTIQEVAGVKSKKTRLEERIGELDDYEVRVELIDMHQKYEDLERNYEISKEISEHMTDDWRNSELRARDFEK